MSSPKGVLLDVDSEGNGICGQSLLRTAEGTLVSLVFTAGFPLERP